jgi:hypothetical protein
VTPLRRYRGGTHDVTTGYADRALFPVDEGSLGLLYTAPQGATTVALYNCQLGTSADFFVSTDLMCEGQRIIGLEGYALTASAANTYPLYRCVVGGAQHFVSHDPKCEGQKTESLLGYALSQ